MDRLLDNLQPLRNYVHIILCTRLDLDCRLSTLSAHLSTNLNFQHNDHLGTYLDISHYSRIRLIRHYLRIYSRAICRHKFHQDTQFVIRFHMLSKMGNPQDFQHRLKDQDICSIQQLSHQIIQSNNY